MYSTSRYTWSGGGKKRRFVRLGLAQAPRRDKKRTVRLGLAHGSWTEATKRRLTFDLCQTIRLPQRRTDSALCDEMIHLWRMAASPGVGGRRTARACAVHDDPMIRLPRIARRFVFGSLSWRGRTARARALRGDRLPAVCGLRHCRKFSSVRLCGLRIAAPDRRRCCR